MKKADYGFYQTFSNYYSQKWQIYFVIFFSLTQGCALVTRCGSPVGTLRFIVLWLATFWAAPTFFTTSKASRRLKDTTGSRNTSSASRPDSFAISLRDISMQIILPHTNPYVDFSGQPSSSYGVCARSFHGETVGGSHLAGKLFAAGHHTPLQQGRHLGSQAMDISLECTILRNVPFWNSLKISSI